MMSTPRRRTAATAADSFSTIAVTVARSKLGEE
jgi:hypothetical protein